MRAAGVAFEQLYRRHAPLLLAFIATRVHFAARDDLHQDVWRRVWHRLSTQFHGGNFNAWLYQIARNAILDQRKKRTFDSLADETSVPDSRSMHSDHRLLEQERMEALRGCLEKLKPPLAAIVRARLAGDDYADVCERLRLRPRQAHKLFHTAKEQLKTCVERVLK